MIKVVVHTMRNQKHPRTTEQRDQAESQLEKQRNQAESQLEKQRERKKALHSLGHRAHQVQVQDRGQMVGKIRKGGAAPALENKGM